MRKFFKFYLDYSREHSDVSTTVMAKIRNACFVADTLDETLKPVYVKHLTSDYCVYSLSPQPGAIEGRLIHDTGHKRMIISDGVRIYSYIMDTIKQLRNYNDVDNSAFLKVYGARSEKQVTSENFDSNGELMNRQARDGFHIYPEEMAQYSFPGNTRDNSIVPYKYVLQLLMWDPHAFETYKKRILTYDFENLIINHMNNDCRDNAKDNLELVTAVQNNLHGWVVQEIHRVRPELTYDFVIQTGKKYNTKHALRFRLPAARAAAVCAEIDTLVNELAAEFNV
jgi:hypothetical protein